MEEKTVEYCFDSNIYSGEDIKDKIEEIKKSFNRISNKPIVVSVELNELGMYVLSFKVYAKRKIAKMKPKKINKVYIESIGEKSNGYINQLIDNNDDKYIKKLKSKSKAQKEIEKQKKIEIKLEKQKNIEKMKAEKELEKQKNIEQKEKNKKLKVQNKKQKELEYQERLKEKEQLKLAKQQEIQAQKELEKQQKERKKILKEQFKQKNHSKVVYVKEQKYNSTSKIEYVDIDENNKTFTEIISNFIKMLKNMKLPKLEHNNKNDESQIGEKHYWSDNYIPKEYGKYKETKKYKPL